MATKFRFLDLPGELRNRVYAQILPPPTHGIDEKYFFESSLSAKACTSLLRSCRQVRKEVMGLLYGDRELMITVKKPHGGEALEITFFGRLWRQEFFSFNFSFLKHIRELWIDLHVFDDADSICRLQDILFTFLKGLTDDHHLHTLQVRLRIRAGDGSSDDQEPPQLENPHRLRMAAFLLDPLRNIRLAKSDNGRRGFCTIEVRDLSPQLKASFIHDLENCIESGPNSILDYAIFHRYDIVRCKNSKQYLEKLGNRFAKLRIVGDVQGFRALAGAFEVNALSWNGWIPNELAPLRVFLTRLRKLVPAADSDVSHYGYALANRTLEAAEAVNGKEIGMATEEGSERQV
jgi:hypothetical protein